MSVKKLLADFLASLPDDDTPEPLGTDQSNGDGVKESPADTEGDKPGKIEDTPAPAASTTEPSTVENTEVDAPPEPKDVTVINSADMVDSSVDMRLAAFYTKQQELEDTVKILLSEVKDLKNQFSAVETAIDAAADTSPTAATIDTLINMI